MRKSLIYGLIWAAWLSGWLGAMGVDCTTLKFWLIFVPVVIFTNLEKNAFKNENKN